MKAEKSGYRVYVGNIPGSTTKEEIIKAFQEFGKITGIDIKYNRNANGTNYAFIEYENYDSAKKTVQKKNGQNFMGNMLKVEYTNDKKNNEGNIIPVGKEKLKGFMRNLRLPRNRSNYRVVVKNFPKRKIQLDYVKKFLMKAGKVIHTQLEDEITIAEYDTKEGMLRAVNTLDRTLYNNRSKVYVRVIKDFPHDDSEVEDSIKQLCV